MEFSEMKMFKVIKKNTYYLNIFYIKIWLYNSHNKFKVQVVSFLLVQVKHCDFENIFLGAKLLYKRLCLSVGWSVCRVPK